jgi:hypothetical protein
MELLHAVITWTDRASVLLFAAASGAGAYFALQLGPGAGLLDVWPAAAAEEARARVVVLLSRWEHWEKLTGGRRRLWLGLAVPSFELLRPWLGSAIILPTLPAPRLASFAPPATPAGESVPVVPPFDPRVVVLALSVTASLLGEWGLCRARGRCRACILWLPQSAMRLAAAVFHAMPQHAMLGSATPSSHASGSPCQGRLTRAAPRRCRRPAAARGHALWAPGAGRPAPAAAAGGSPDAGHAGGQRGWSHAAGRAGWAAVATHAASCAPAQVGPHASPTPAPRAHRACRTRRPAFCRCPGSGPHAVRAVRAVQGQLQVDGLARVAVSASFVLPLAAACLWVGGSVLRVPRARWSLLSCCGALPGRPARWRPCTHNDWGGVLPGTQAGA